MTQKKDSADLSSKQKLSNDQMSKIRGGNPGDRRSPIDPRKD